MDHMHRTRAVDDAGVPKTSIEFLCAFDETVAALASGVG